MKDFFSELLPFFASTLTKFYLISSIFHKLQASPNANNYYLKEYVNSKDVEVLKNLTALNDQQPYIIFWRPQKVGSSTLSLILLSYSFRYDIIQRHSVYANSLCIRALLCLRHSQYATDNSVAERLLSVDVEKYLSSSYETELEKLNYYMSFSHEVCNLKAEIVESTLRCVLGKQNLSMPAKPFDCKELFLVRDPISRMISIYYYGGKLLQATLLAQNKNFTSRGISKHGKEIKFNGLTYHGDERTPPSEIHAINYAQNLPVTQGFMAHGNVRMASWTWSLFSNNPDDAVEVIKTDRIMTLVLERFDESLVVMSHYMNWSLADVVTVINRKYGSPHPTYESWPIRSVHILNKTLYQVGEYAVYTAAQTKLNQRISKLMRLGVDVNAEIALLRDMRTRVKNLCLDESYLKAYKSTIASRGFEAAGIPVDDSDLGDAGNHYYKKKHGYHFNGQLYHSFDLCGSCEAHSILLGYRLGLASSVLTASSYVELPKIYTESRIEFTNCPKLL